MIAKVCDRESRRDTWFENRLVMKMNEKSLEKSGKTFINFKTIIFLFPDIIVRHIGVRRLKMRQTWQTQSVLMKRDRSLKVLMK